MLNLLTCFVQIYPCSLELSYSFSYFHLAEKLSEAEELASLSVQEAESLQRRIAGLEERLEFNQASPTTPLILPPSPRIPSDSKEVSQGEILTECNTPPARRGESTEESTVDVVADGMYISASRTTVCNAPNSSENQNSVSDILEPSQLVEIREMELSELKNKVKRLQEELTQTRKEYNSLHERECILQQTLDCEKRKTKETLNDTRQDLADGLVTPVLRVSQGYIIIIYFIYVVFKSQNFSCHIEG